MSNLVIYSINVVRSGSFSRAIRTCTTKSPEMIRINCGMCQPELRHARSTSLATTGPSNGLGWQSVRSMSIFSRFFKRPPKPKPKTEDEKEETAIALKTQVLNQMEKRDKASLLDVIDSYTENTPNRRGHLEFINACLRQLEDLGLERDLEVYKKLLNVFPKGKMVAKNQLQVEFLHYPRHQQCATDLLETMESHGVMPDKDVQMIIMEVFGYRSFPMRKFYRMMYWMPKFKNASPWPLPNPLPNDTLQLALLALQRIASVDLQSTVTAYQTSEVKDSVDHTWLVSAQSPDQQALIAKHPDNVPIFVEGASRIWLRRSSIAYFNLRADARGPLFSPPGRDIIDDVSNITSNLTGEEEDRQDVCIPPCVHEQEDGTILAVCATGTSSRDSLLSWIRILQVTNPRLQQVPVLFKLKSPSTAVVPLNSSGLVDESLEAHVENKEFVVENK